MKALDLIELLTLETGERWGHVATDVQRADALAILDDERPERYHFVSRARGFSKTTDLAAVALAVLLAQAPPGSRSYAVAADQAQARLLLDSIEGFVRRNPELARYVTVQAWRAFVPTTGASLEALPADSAGAWGLRPYFAVCDELAAWGTTGGPRRIWEAIATAIPKTRGRLVTITTAGDPSHWAHRVREHALADPLWRVSETPGPPPWMPEDLIDEQRRRLPESSYRRLFCNEWVATDEALVSPDELSALVTLDGPLPPQLGHRYAIGLDLGLKKDRTALVVAHAETIERVPPGEAYRQVVGSRIVLDRLQIWKGSRSKPVELQQVEEFVAFASAEYAHAPVVFDPWQAQGMMQRLARRGIRTAEFTFSQASVGRLASTLLTLARNGGLALPPDQDLLDELLRLRVRESSPGVLRVDHDPDAHDDQAIALGLACQYLLERPARGGAVSFGVERRDPFEGLADPLDDPLTAGMAF